MRRAGTEQRVLQPDEIRDINNRRIDIVPNVATSPIIDKRSEYKPYIEPTPSPKAEVKESIISKRLPFIEANTKDVSVGHLKMSASSQCSARTMRSQSPTTHS